MAQTTTGGAPAKVGRRRLIWGAVAIVAVIGGALALRFWFAPLGPTLVTAEPGQAQPTRAAGATAEAGATAAAPGLEPTAEAEALEIAGDAAPAPSGASCGERGVMQLLVLGNDSRTNDYSSGRADFIRAVRADFGDSSVRMLSVPRDLWVPIPHLADHGIIESRVNAAYAYGYYYQLPGGGETLMAETLSQAIGLEFDHYLVINFAAVEAGIDAIGGVDIELPKDVDGTLQGLPYFEAGLNHMDGATLLQYVRVRFIDSDLYRIDRQNQVLLAVRAKLLSPQVVGAIPGLVEAMQDLVYTDLSPAQLSSLACLGQTVGLENFTALKIGEAQVTPHTTAEGAAVLLPQYDLIAQVVALYLAEPGE